MCGLVLALLGAGAATGYTVVLKDGATIVTAKEYQIEGNRAKLTLQSGTETWIDLVEIDIPATEKTNQNNLGTALVVDGAEVRPLSRDRSTQQRRDTLADLLRRRQAEAQAASEAGGESLGNSLRVRQTPAGYNDLATLQRATPENREAAGDLDVMLSSSSISSYKIHQGTQPDRLFLELTADNDTQVFESLAAVAQTFENLRNRHRDLAALEIYMATDSGSRGGQFVLDRENASLLVSEQMTLEEFFLVFVEF